MTLQQGPVSIWRPSYIAIGIPVWNHYIIGLVQDCSNSIANTLELLQSCTKPSISIGTSLPAGQSHHIEMPPPPLVVLPVYVQNLDIIVTVLAVNVACWPWASTALNARQCTYASLTIECNQLSNGIQCFHCPYLMGFTDWLCCYFDFRYISSVSPWNSFGLFY